MQMGKEIRTTAIQATPAAASEGDKHKYMITGKPILYEQPADIATPAGPYREVIRQGALDGADLSDIRLLYNHDLGQPPLARTPKTMTFTISPAGLEMSAELPQTEQGKSVYTAVQRGDLSGMSFGFKVPDGGDTYDPATNTRTILKIEKVYEFSITPFPAYPATSVEARAVMDERKKTQIKINQILKRGI